MRISPSGDESGGLMEHDGERWGDPNKFAIHFNVIATAGLRAEVRAGFTVDSDPPRRDQFIAIPARSGTGCGEKTIQRSTTSHVRLCLWQADDFLAVLPLAAFF